MLTPSGGTVGAPSGATNADGEFTTTATLAEGQSQLTIEVRAFDRPGGTLLAEDTVTAQLALEGTVAIDAFYAHISVRAGKEGDFDDGDQEAFTGSWSMSGSAAAAGASASVTASATLTQDGGTHRYEGSGHLVASSGSSDAGGAAGVDGVVDFTVSGGEVSWSVTQSMPGSFPPGSGCLVRFGSQEFGASAAGIAGPGTHQIMHSCGFGAIAPDFPDIESDTTFSITIGRG